MKPRFDWLAFTVIFCLLSALLYFNTSVVPQIQIVLLSSLQNDQQQLQGNPLQGNTYNIDKAGPYVITAHLLNKGSSENLVETNLTENLSDQKQSLKNRQKVKDSCSNFKDSEKFDCDPEGSVSEAKCQARGCCWHPQVKPPSHPVRGLPLGVPWCFYPDGYPGYIVDSVDYRPTGVRVQISRKTNSYYSDDIKTAVMDVTYRSDQTLRIKIFDPSKNRYEVPIYGSPSTQTTNDTLYSFSVSEVGQPFNFQLVRKTATGLVPVIVLRTNRTAPFMFSDQYIQLASFLPSNYIYGLGEHRGSLLHDVNWKQFTMWNKDRPPKENTNLYGSHPFYLVMEGRDGGSHGVFLANSNAMDVILQPAPAITWRTIGGIIDMYVFLGPSPAAVIQQYTEVIGRSFMPPYWSLGYHLCRWGYKTANGTLAITDRVQAAGIPQDVQWNDIDYMDRKLDFTTGPKFGDQSTMVDNLHKRGMHYIMILDPGISTSQKPGSYMPYDVGIKMDIFIKDSSGKPIVGKVWPGNTVFPDFTHPLAAQYWTSLIREFHDNVPFDGIWIDMNEISNFVAGSLSGCPSNSSLENPPYLPAVEGGSLRFNTLCASARQNLSVCYNTHNLYGLTETMATYKALQLVRGKRPFIISRSTFPGQGQFGGHWSGDNDATYSDMYFSIPEILNFNMFGISMIGADICGFRSETNEQLCVRWHQLGAFYPFSRNHNTLGMKDQDPAAFSHNAVMAIKSVYLVRYSLLPYLYTLFHKSHQMGHTVARPLFFEFPEDEKTYSIDRQFLWGEALMISPVLTKDATTVDIYFPGFRWYDFYNGRHNYTTGSVQNLPAPINQINLHVREGYILPMQEPALTTTDSRKNPFSLLVALNEKGEAQGSLFWDDGDTIGTYTSEKYITMQFQAGKQVLQSQILHNGYLTSATWGSITVYGVTQNPTSVTVNGQTVKNTYDHNYKVLHVSDLTLDLVLAFKMAWK
ncbi:lysosomal alpha-glucosidase-like [Mizuhopecten yessoensis]|uniref:lysosomal alpha-glucosidase-like n=1 Tax=Mizuhopecten yessoensis TaxID=6573 RepID=UPI000B45E91A|nr:lysosomal alpha-glucosidase-like [Mizuhopecten yessoensis]XP_021379414.1 lysosomal alpha-glucosidase-like [Mizuhopecten yessoensis]XP_021379416.1 lysosomal alpha-glucosidase-like [Mizuhopecten yessoensis]